MSSARFAPLAAVALVLASSVQTAAQSSPTVTLRCTANNGKATTDAVWYFKVGPGVWMIWSENSYWHADRCDLPRLGTCEITEEKFTRNSNDMYGHWSQTMINRRTGAISYRDSGAPDVWWTGTCQPSAEPQQPAKKF